MPPNAAMPPTPEAAGPGEDPRPARSRAMLIDAATKLLGEGGIDAVTIDSVTRTAGVARATLYRHFGTGTELLAAAFERLIPPVPPTPPQGPVREQLLTLLTSQAKLIENAPLQLTVLSWLGLSLQGSVASEPDAGEQDEDRPRLRLLRRRIIEQYRQPFDAILTSDDARATLRSDLDAGTALAQLVGPLIFNRLVTDQPIDEAFCARIVNDFVAANTHDRN